MRHGRERGTSSWWVAWLVVGVAAVLAAIPVAAELVPSGGEFQVNTYTTNDQNFPAVASAADGDFVVAWQSNTQDGSLAGVFAQRYASDGTAQGSEFQVNTYTANSQSSPAVASAADGDFVVAWRDATRDGSGSGVFAQRYASDGTARGSEFQVNTYTTANQQNPTVASAADGDFVVAWRSFSQERQR